MLMKEYRIKITGTYDVIVLSPKIISTLLARIRHAAVKELVVPAEEIFPRGYAEYLTRVLNANAEPAGALPDRNVYALAAEQIMKLQCNEQDCFDRVEVAEPETNPRFDINTNEAFYILTRQAHTHFRYLFRDENEEEISIVLEYL